MHCDPEEREWRRPLFLLRISLPLLQVFPLRIEAFVWDGGANGRPVAVLGLHAEKRDLKGSGLGGGG